MNSAPSYVVLCLGVLSTWSLSARGEWFAEVDAGGLYDSNVTGAQRKPDIRADTAASITADGGYFDALNGSDGLTLSIETRNVVYHRFHGINEIDVGASAAYKHKFDLGFAAPWASLSVTGSRDDFVGDIRDSDRVEGRMEVGKRFSESVDASFGAIYARRYARNEQPIVPGISGKVFDLRGETVFVRAAYAATEKLQIGARLSVRRGAVVSTTRKNLAIFEASAAIAPDAAFGNDFFAYRLRGTTQSALLSASWALSERASINVAYADERTRAYEGLGYRGRIANMSFTYSY